MPILSVLKVKHGVKNKKKNINQENNIMSQSPAISVVIPAYNEESALSACLDSLCGQDCSFPYEIIVVNNASTDKQRP